MKSSDIKIGKEYAYQRSNYNWDRGEAERVRVVVEHEWNTGWGYNQKTRKGFRVQLLDRDTLVYTNATARELRSTWSDFAERRARIEANIAEIKEQDFNRNVLVYTDMAQIERAIRKIDVTREPTKMDFYSEQEMRAAQAAGWDVDGEYTYVVMDTDHKGLPSRKYLRPRFEVSRRDAGLLALFVLRAAK